MTQTIKRELPFWLAVIAAITFAVLYLQEREEVARWEVVGAYSNFEGERYVEALEAVKGTDCAEIMKPILSEYNPYQRQLEDVVDAE